MVLVSAVLPVDLPTALRSVALPAAFLAPESGREAGEGLSSQRAEVRKERERACTHSRSCRARNSTMLFEGFLDFDGGALLLGVLFAHRVRIRGAEMADGADCARIGHNLTRRSVSRWCSSVQNAPMQ